MLSGHFTKALQTSIRQLHGKSTAVARAGRAWQKTFTLKLVSNSSYVAAGHHQAPGKFAHAQPARAAFQLGHQVKPRKGGIELATQAETNLIFNTYRAR